MKNLTERHVQAIWYDATLRPRRLYTRRGSEVNVVSPGEWNLTAGPDFRNAVLEIGKDRRRICGDVEVHLCPADWDFHHHGADPEYRNVIAHVTWGCGPDPASLPPGAITIWLGRFVNGNPAFDPLQIDLAAYPYAHLPEEKCRCEEAYHGKPDEAIDILRKAGRHRLRMKARRLAGRLAEIPRGGRRQIFYEEVMTALGYSRNARQFRRVAERIPIDELPQTVAEAQVALRTAGSFEEFDRVSVRPNNSPEVRLDHAALVFTGTPVMELAEVGDFSRSECRAMIGAMSRSGEVHCMGRGRAAAVLANVIVPWAMAEGRIDEVPEWLPAEDVSDPVRLTAFRMFGRDHNPAALYSANGLHIQGLLQIRRDCCLKEWPECHGCSVAGGRFD